MNKTSSHLNEETTNGKKICVVKDPSYYLSCRMCVIVRMADEVTLKN